MKYNFSCNRFDFGHLIFKVKNVFDPTQKKKKIKTEDVVKMRCNSVHTRKIAGARSP